MGRTLLLLLFVCTVTFAMVPRNRVAREVRKCPHQTPCAWTFYERYTKEVTKFVKNTYCECAKELECVKNEDDEEKLSYVFRCRAEGEVVDS